MMSASSTINKKKGKTPKGKPKSSTAPSQETYLAKMAKKYLAADNMTMSKTAIVEVGLLMNDAINTIVHNADKILTYSGHQTFGKKTAEGATYLALSGLLRNDAVKAGEKAVVSYDNWKPPAPVPAA